MEFAAEEELTGFRFFHCELLIKFVQGLLCPECQRPLGAGRLSSVTEDRTDLASHLRFHCGCDNTVSFRTSKQINKVFEVNRRFPLALFPIGRQQAQGRKFLGSVNMLSSLNNKTWANYRDQVRKATDTVANRSKQQAAEEAGQAYGGGRGGCNCVR